MQSQYDLKLFSRLLDVDNAFAFSSIKNPRTSSAGAPYHLQIHFSSVLVCLEHDF